MLASPTPRRRWKQWLLLPLSALLLLALGCEQELEETPPPPPPPALAPAAPEALAPPPPPPPAFTSAEQMPEYEGGQAQLLADIGKLVKYPVAAKDEKLEGQVVVRFIVDARGRLQAAEVTKGLGNRTPGAQALNEAALTAVRNLPGKWKPGRQAGKAVDVLYTVPITFSLAASGPLDLGWALYARFRGC